MEQLHNVRIGVRETLPSQNNQRIALDAECGYMDGAVGASGTVHCPDGVSGKYLTIFIDDQIPELLVMCEVTITGIQNTEIAGNLYHDFLCF